MKADEGHHLRAFYAFCSAYADLKEEGIISSEQQDEIMELLDRIEELSEEELRERLMEIFPDYEPGDIPRPGEGDIGLEDMIDN